MIIKILTLFPQMVRGPLNESILKNAQERGKIDLEYINIRDFSKDKHKKVDDYPYGGGPGMVMTAQPIFDCYNETVDNMNLKARPRTIYCSPKGKTFTQELAYKLSREEHLVFICGHYEGVDQRVIDKLVTDEISIGDYVLTGGELAAAVMVDAIARLIPGVLGQKESHKEESFSSGFLEYPHYTRPQEFRGLKVPRILLSGNHEEIAKWRKKNSIQVTLKRRPDLINYEKLGQEEKKIIDALISKN